jgi:mRNA-degrading endonuclease RelE of RelBE toxin-antitoxin system
MYAIEYTDDAEYDLRYFRKHEQQIIASAIERQLRFQPMTITTNRFRRNPPDIAAWELRVGLFRVYYDVDEQVRVVTVTRIWEKPNNEVYFRGRRSGRS